jgi:hypothetical protein
MPKRSKRSKVLLSKSSRTRTRTSSARHTIGLSKVLRKDKTRKVLSILGYLKQFNKFYKSLSTIEKSTLSSYKGIGYNSINKYLYNNNKLNELHVSQELFVFKLKEHFSKNTKDLLDISSINPSNIKLLVELYVNKNIVEPINNIDKIFQNPLIPKLTGKELLYRGTREHSITTKNSKIGDEIVIKNFVSSSTQQSISEMFITHKAKDSCCMYVLTNIKDIPFIYLPWNIKASSKLSKYDISQTFNEEFEMLLPRGLKFKITDKKMNDYKIIDSWGSRLHTKKMSFAQLDKIANKLNIDINELSKMSESEIQNIYDKMSIKIQTYYLTYIGRDETKPIEPYIYDPKLNLHIYPPRNMKQIQSKGFPMQQDNNTN